MIIRTSSTMKSGATIVLKGASDMNNKKLGNQFERDLCEVLAANGFWAYNCPNKTSGQPADIIASRNGHPCLIDCKECTNDVFDTARVEENQKNSMMLWDYTGNGEGYFALRLSDGRIYMVHQDAIMLAMHEKRTLNEHDIAHLGEPFYRWVVNW